MIKISARKPCQISDSLKAKFPEFLANIYASRGVMDAEEVEYSLKKLIHYNSLTDIEKAAQIIGDAVIAAKRIMIIGDYDVDGATSTSIAVSALRAFGAKDVQFIVPDRVIYGYGLSPEIVDVAKQSNPDLLITVDNGISSVDGIERANSLGMPVVVTDHHLAGAELPKAAAIVNPNQPNDKFPSKCMAGCGVIYYTMLAVRAYLLEQGWFVEAKIEVPKMTQFLDLVSLGTIADVVPLDQNNRNLVQLGLDRIRAERCRPGIKALLKVAGRNISRLQSSDLGFVLGPRLNAAGRIDDMTIGINCLLAKTDAEALPLATQLNQLNITRREIEADMKEQAFEILEKLDLSDDMPTGVCLYDATWHQGVIGLVASRVKDKWHRPVIAFAKDKAAVMKGSARSVEGVHIRDVLDSVATKNPGMIIKFGGHAMAAGLSIDMAQFEKFKLEFAKEVEVFLPRDKICGEILSDGDLPEKDIHIQNAELIQSAGPWGQAFQQPMFNGEFELIDQRLVGEKHLKMVLAKPGGDVYYDAIAFYIDLSQWPNHNCRKIHLAYQLDVNEFRGQRKLQLMVSHMDAIKESRSKNTSDYRDKMSL